MNCITSQRLVAARRHRVQVDDVGVIDLRERAALGERARADVGAVRELARGSP